MYRFNLKSLSNMMLPFQSISFLLLMLCFWFVDSFTFLWTFNALSCFDCSSSISLHFPFNRLFLTKYLNSLLSSIKVGTSPVIHFLFFLFTIESITLSWIRQRLFHLVPKSLRYSHCLLSLIFGNLKISRTSLIRWMCTQ